MNYEFRREYSLKKRALEITNEPLSVIEWDADESNLFGYGVNDENELKYFIAPADFGLFVGLRNPHHLAIFNNNPLIEKITKIDTDLKSNDLTVFHSFTGKDDVLLMYKLHTGTFYAACKLYRELDNASCLNFATVPINWNIETFLMFEIIYLNHGNLMSTHFKNSVLYYDKFYVDPSTKLLKQKPHYIKFIPKISFDVETVSPLAERVPTGELFSDICFSISFVIELEPETVKVITLINLPAVTEKFEIDKKYTIGDRETIIFNSERDMLKKAFEILSYKKYFLCLGYNSAFYDMPYLMQRAFMLNMPEYKNFVYQHGVFAYGIYMTHVDLYLYSSKYFELEDYKLNTIAKYCLEKSKVDLNAVNLRYVFDYFRSSNDINHPFEFPDEKFTLKEAIHYNEIDAMLVYEIFITSKMTESLQDISKSYMINWVRILDSKINENYSNKILRTGCFLGRLFASNHLSKNVIIPNIGLLKLHNKLIVSQVIDEESKICGGMNYCTGRQRENNILAFDYTAFYPYLMGENNISHETVNIVRVKELRQMWDLVKNRNCEIRLFVDVRGETKLETQLRCRMLINGSLNHGTIVNSLDNLSDDDRVVILNKEQDGILSMFIKGQNEIRDKSKALKKELESILTAISDEMIKKTINKQEEDYEFNFDDDEDMEEEEEEESESVDVNSSILQLKIERKDITKLEIDELNKYKVEINGELSRIMAYYRTLKRENSSYYGLLASMANIKGPHIASALTSRARFFIIETAREVQRLGGKIIFIDTDSVFTNNPSHCNLRQLLPNKMKSLNPALRLNVKVYNTIEVFKKKVYIFDKDDGIYSRGINKNGPKLWKELLQDQFTKLVKNNKEFVLADAQPWFEEIYGTMFNQIKEDKSLVICKSSAKDINEYAKNTAIKSMLQRELALNPFFQYDKKISYFHAFHNTATTPFYVAATKLDEYKLYNLNLVKFASKIMNYVIQLIDFSIVLNDKHDFVYNYEKILKKYEIAAFMKVRNEIMGFQDAEPINLLEVGNIPELDDV